MMREAGSWSTTTSTQAADSWPLVSVVIVVRNEAAHIGECLARITEQDYPLARLEILVVDGMSVDGTAQVAESFGGGAVALRVLKNPAQGRAQGLNIGVRAASGAVIARLDARTVVERDYLRKCVRALQDTGADNVGGVQRPLTDGGMQEAIGVAMAHPFGVGDAQFRLGRLSGFVDTVYPGCFRRGVFDRVGLFDDTAPIISEDSDLNMRIRRAGGRVYLDTGIVAYYRPRETLRDLWRLYFRYGGARAGTVLKHRRVDSLRQLVPPLFVLSLAGLAALSLWRRTFAAPLVGIVALYVLVAALVAVTVALRRRTPGLAARLLAVFPIMHVAWALGFWRRLTQRPRPDTYWGY